MSNNNCESFEDKEILEKLEELKLYDKNYNKLVNKKLKKKKIKLIQYQEKI